MYDADCNLSEIPIPVQCQGSSSVRSRLRRCMRKSYRMLTTACEKLDHTRPWGCMKPKRHPKQSKWQKRLSECAHWFLNDLAAEYVAEMLRC